MKISYFQIFYVQSFISEIKDHIGQICLYYVKTTLETKLKKMWQIGTLPKHYNKHYLFLKFSVQSFTCEMKVKMLSPTDRHTYLLTGGQEYYRNNLPVRKSICLS